MKKIILIVLAVIITGAGIAYALANKSDKKENMVMDKKVLIAYFSATGTTKKVAQNLAKATGGDLYEIKPAVLYTSADLNWMDKNSRTSVEMKDWSFRPKMVEDNFNIKDYDIIFLGFPIWWYIAPTIINTFLEKHDFSNKKIILFATSGGSRFGSTVKNIAPSVSESTKIIEGQILNNNPDEKELKTFLTNLNITE